MGCTFFTQVLRIDTLNWSLWTTCISKVNNTVLVFLCALTRWSTITFVCYTLTLIDSSVLLCTSTRHNLNTMGSLLAPRRLTSLLAPRRLKEPPCMLVPRTLHQSPCLHQEISTLGLAACMASLRRFNVLGQPKVLGQPNTAPAILPLFCPPCYLSFTDVQAIEGLAAAFTDASLCKEVCGF